MSKSIHEQYLSGTMGRFREFDWFTDTAPTGYASAQLPLQSPVPANDRFPWSPFVWADMFRNGNCVTVIPESTYRENRFRDETHRTHIGVDDLYRVLANGPAGEYILIGA